MERFKKDSDTFRAKGLVEKENRDIEGMLEKCFQAKSTNGWVEDHTFYSSHEEQK